MKIGPLDLSSVCCVAEISNNHNQNLDRALTLIEAAKGAGAAAVKFQCYTPDELIANRGDGPAPPPWDGMTMRELYSQAMTPLTWFPRLFAHAAAVGIPAFSSVFGPESLATLEYVGNPLYKISKLDRGVAALLRDVLATGKPVIVSEAEWADPRYDESQDALENILYCPGGYPCRSDEVQLNAYDQDYFIGMSIHCLAPELPIAAVARGARILEYHFDLSDRAGRFEAELSHTPESFRRMVDAVRATEELMG